MNGAQDRNRHPADEIMVAILQPHEVRATNQGRGAGSEKAVPWHCGPPPGRKTELILISGSGRCGDYVFSPETTPGAVKPFWRSYSRAKNGFTLGPMTETMSMVSGGFTAVSSRFQAVSLFPKPSVSVSVSPWFRFAGFQ